MKILDLGCGFRKYEYINRGDIVVGVDKFNAPPVDVVHDLEKVPYPFKDNEFDMVIARGVLEHISNINGFMNECWRVLKPKGIMKIWCPYGLSSCGAPDHKRIVTFRTFNSFTPENADSQQIGLSKARFNIIKRHLSFSFNKIRLLNKIFDPLINLNHRAMDYLFLGILPIREIYVELEAVK